MNPRSHRKFPIANLINLTVPPASDWINYVRPVYPALNNSGIALSQGDKHRPPISPVPASSWTAAESRFCVLSDSYNTLPGDNANIDVSNGDLPGSGNPSGRNTPVQVLKGLSLWQPYR